MSAAPALRVVGPAPDDAPDERPTIRVDWALDRQGNAAISAIGAEPNLYSQAGHLVRVVRVDPSSARPERPDGTPEVRRAAVETVRELMATHARWVKPLQQGFTDVHPPKDVAAGVMKRGEWPGVRPLEGISETPILRPDGTILSRPGYDAATRTLLLPGCDWPTVRDEPEQKHAFKALVALRELFDQFPFVKPEMRFVPVAAILTLFARPAIRGAVPAFGFDASIAGAGKTLISNVINLIHSGRYAEPNTYPSDDIELEKSLGAEALSGAPVVDFDNIENVLEGGPLLKCITAKDKVRLRVLGLSSKVSIRWRAVVLLGGNNLVVGRQMSRRLILARIEPREERPEERTGFAISDLPGYVQANRGRLGVAALTILRAWHVAGCPTEGVKALGSFEEWTSIARAIVYAGGPDVTLLRPVGGPQHDDPETSALRVLLPRLATLAGPSGASASAILRTLYPGGKRPGAGEAPDGWDDVRESIETLCQVRGTNVPSANTLGIKLRALKGRWIGGLRLVNLAEVNGKDVARWGVETR